MLAIEQLEQDLGRHSGAIDAFFHQRSFPIVEGRQVTFVFRGHAQEVFLQHWIRALPQQQQFRRLGNSDVWGLTLELPRYSRIEYKIGLSQGGQMGMRGHGGRAQLIRDPLNPHHALDPFGANSVVHTEGYEEPDFTLFDENARPGEIQDHEIDSPAFGGRRQVQVYLPARYRTARRYPLLVIHDGEDFQRFAKLQVVLDNLIHRLEIPPMVCALTTSPNRMEEYPNDERHARHVAEEILPFMEQNFSLVDDPGARGLLGASFGAIAALSTAWRYPGQFNRLCLMSGSLLFTDIGEHEGGPAFDPVVEFMNAFRKAPGLPSRQIFVSCGVYEPMIYYNRSMVPLFQATGARVRFAEARDGHNWQNWRDRMREGLSWLFPGPLWLVYE